MEPTLASAEEMDEIVDMRRRPAGEKPVMRVTAEDLRGSGVLKLLPEFMAQIARSGGRGSEPGDMIDPAILDDADDADHEFELDEEQARGRTHVEMDIVAGILEEKGAGGEEEEDQEDFELAIPSAGTAPSKSAATTAAAGPPMIRPLSSSSSESEATPDYDESSPPILQRDFDLECDQAPAPAAAKPPLPTGRSSRARSHCVSVSMPTPDSLCAHRKLPNAALDDDETSSSGTSSDEEEEDEDAESEEDERDGEDGRQDQDQDAHVMEVTEGLPAPSARPPRAGRIAIQPDESRKRSCTESSLVRDEGAPDPSDRKRARPLIEEMD